MNRIRHWIEPLVCCIIATASLVMFVANDPWSTYDGNFLLLNCEVYPYLWLTPLAAFAGLYTAGSRPPYQLWACMVLVVFVFLPETYRVAGYCWRVILPMAFE